jgi:hypothetical protein
VQPPSPGAPPERLSDAGSALVNDGFLKASHRNSHTSRISGGDSKSLVPVAVPVDITLQTGAASALHLPPGW